MFKQKFRLLLIVVLSLILVDTSVFAFHKINSKNNIVVYENPELEKEQVKIKYCAFKVKPKKEKGSAEQAINEEGKLGWVLTGSHDLKKITAGKKLLISQQFGERQPLKKEVRHETSLQDVLKIHCLQYDDEERPLKYSKSSMAKLYLIIAEKNNLIDENGDFSVNEPIGEELYKNGITIDEPNVVYYIPDYLIDQYNKHQEKEKKKRDKQKKREEQAAKDKKWVKENYTSILKSAKKKRDNFLSIQANDLKKVEQLDAKAKEFIENLNIIEKDIENTIQFDILNKDDREIIENLKLLNDIKNNNLEDIQISVLTLESEIETSREYIKNIFNKKNKKFSSKLLAKAKEDYSNLNKAVNKINESISKNSLKQFEKFIKQADLNNLKKLSNNINTNIDKNIKLINEHNKSIEEAKNLINETRQLDVELSEKTSFTQYIIYIGIALLVIFGIGLIAYVLFQRKELTQIKSETKRSESRFSELQGQIKSTSEQIRKTSTTSSSQTQQREETVVTKPKTQGEILAAKYDDMVSDYKDCLEDFSKVAAFKQKWNGLALSRKERQDGTKTILINSTRAFEKAEIWCVNFGDKYFAFPGSSVKSNMAAYMNLDFEKASRDFKGVFAISSGSSYLTDPALLRRGGAGFVVEKQGKLTFPT